jgi:hypothetical protein
LDLSFGSGSLQSDLQGQIDSSRNVNQGTNRRNEAGGWNARSAKPNQCGGEVKLENREQTPAIEKPALFPQTVQPGRKSEGS